MPGVEDGWQECCLEAKDSSAARLDESRTHQACKEAAIATKILQRWGRLGKHVAEPRCLAALPVVTGFCPRGLKSVDPLGEHDQEASV